MSRRGEAFERPGSQPPVIDRQPRAALSRTSGRHIYFFNFGPKKEKRFSAQERKTKSAERTASRFANFAGRGYGRADPELGGQQTEPVVSRSTCPQLSVNTHSSIPKQEEPGKTGRHPVFKYRVPHGSQPQFTLPLALPFSSPSSFHTISLSTVFTSACADAMCGTLNDMKLGQKLTVL